VGEPLKRIARRAVNARLMVPVGVVLGLTVAGFLGAQAVGQRDARRVSAYRARLASTEIQAGVEHGADVAESIRRFLIGHVSASVTNEQFAEVASRWNGPSGLDAAAWVQSVPQSERSTYERRLGRRIVTTTRSGGFAAAAAATSYLPATLVTGLAPMSVPGIDLGAEPGLSAAIARPRTRRDVTATPLTRRSDGTTGIFLVRSAQNRDDGRLDPGFVVLFVPSSSLLAAASQTAGESRLRLTVGTASTRDLGHVATASSAFTALGQRFAVQLPQVPVHGADALLPWIILGGGLVLAALVGRLSRSAAQRATERSRLLADALGAEERERRTLAEALHDHALQNLLSARHELEEAAETVAHPALDRADAAIADTIRQLRDAVFELHPYVLEEAGLKAALRSIAQQAATRADLAVQLDLRYEHRHPREPLIFSVGRELLNNVVRHANASKVSVRLIEGADELRLTVEDDGCGFPPERLTQRLADGHVGIASQRFRLEAAGGSMAIAAAPGRGTRVEIRLPAR
jgi:signal transduction histidine kinase